MADDTAETQNPSSTENKPDPTESLPRPKRRHGGVFWFATLSAGAFAVVWVFQFIHHAIVYRETDDAYIQGHVHKISARLPGNVAEVLARENEIVKSGQALARLDAREYETAVERAKANLAQAEAQVQLAEAAIDQARAEEAESKAATQQAHTQIEEADAKFGVSSIDFERNTRLYGQDARAVSKSEVDTSRAAYNADKAALEGARANFTAVQAKELSAAANVKAALAQSVSARAMVAVQKAAVDDAERELADTIIIAPSDGRIGNKNIETGNRVQVGQALFAVVEPDVWVVANFKETQMGPIKPGQPVEMTIDTFPGKRFSGRVDSVSPATGAQFALLPADNATGNFTKVVQRVPVKIVFDGEGIREIADRIHPGLSTVVNVRIK